MSEKIITKGDTVNICFTTADAEHEVKILYTPRASGDCFVAERVDGTIVNIQTYCKMVKVR